MTDRRLFSPLGAALVFLSGAAGAEETLPSAPDTTESHWEFTLGGGVGYAPDYEGSDDYEIKLLPRVEITYRDLVFLDGPSLGVNLLTITGARSGDRLRIGREETGIEAFGPTRRRNGAGDEMEIGEIGQDAVLDKADPLVVRRSH